ncbi:MAG: hypothetical protein JW795_01650 [Chitinivibrionales bacterium]|nr:hypothetical protein [Chitinivibrionales bacterium]
MADTIFGLSRWQVSFFKKLKAPIDIQRYLDDLAYSADPIYRCPVQVIADQKAHCFDGAIFAAAAMRIQNQPSLILELVPNSRDDDHMITLYKRGRFWGAIGKSNFVGLRFREPIYRSFRELALSYFEDFYNSAGEKTLRGYTLPLDMKRFDDRAWMINAESLEMIANSFDRLRRYSLITQEMARSLQEKDDRSYRAGMHGVNPAGLYQLTA